MFPRKHITHVFDDIEIARFCDLTGDPNTLHNAEKMAEQGVKPYVPMMQIVSAVSWEGVQKMLQGNFGGFDYSVSGALFSDQEMHQRVKVDGVSSDLSNLETAAEIGRMEFRSDSSGWDREYDMEARISVDGQKAYRFTELIGTNRKQVARFLYAVSSMSAVLIDKLLENPEGEFAQNLSERYHSRKKERPAYTGLSVDVFRGVPILGSDNILTFELGSHIEGKRDLTFHTACYQNEIRVYEATATAVLTPERALVRGSATTRAVR